MCYNIRLLFTKNSLKIPKGANRMRISQKNRQHNGKMKKDKILIWFSQDYVGSKY